MRRKIKTLQQGNVFACEAIPFLSKEMFDVTITKASTLLYINLTHITCMGSISVTQHVRLKVNRYNVNTHAV